jgi:predicted lipoprotein with Yx(FWY)xxD motif
VRHLLPVVAVLCVLAAGCGSDNAPRSSVPDPTAAPTSAPPSNASASVSPEPTDTGTPTDIVTTRGTRIISADSEFGPMLFDATGQPIYLFTAESGDRPACYDDCAKNWPPVLTTDAPRGAADVRRELMGSTRRADGSTQVTYAGHPLYYYAHEGKYQVLCHEVEEYGGTWLVVRPNGTPAPA